MYMHEGNSMYNAMTLIDLLTALSCPYLIIWHTKEELLRIFKIKPINYWNINTVLSYFWLNQGPSIPLMEFLSKLQGALLPWNIWTGFHKRCMIFLRTFLTVLCMLLFIPKHFSHIWGACMSKSKGLLMPDYELYCLESAWCSFYTSGVRSAIFWHWD